MNEIGPEHPPTFRAEVIGPVFKAVRDRDSCAVVGAGSMGKSRLVQFMLRPDVRAHAFAGAPAPLFVRADCNRLDELSAWGLFELLLTCLTELCAEAPALTPLLQQAAEVRDRAILHRDSLQARRSLELLTRMIVQTAAAPLVLVLDEFDAIYKAAPPTAMACLRALRDHQKYRLAFILLLRDHPARLRPPAEVEGFYELVARAVISLGPMSDADSRMMIAQLRERRTLPPLDEDAVVALSGGHPGLIGALCDMAARGAPLTAPAAAEDEQVREECRKLLEGLDEHERAVLQRVVAGQARGAGLNRGPADPAASLLLKGLLLDGPQGMRLSIPALAAYLEAGTELRGSLAVDLDHREARLGGRLLDLTRRQYDLLAYLWTERGRTCPYDKVIEAVWGDHGDPELDKNRLENLLGDLRRKIEPIPGNPRHIVTVHGIGLKLVS